MTFNISFKHFTAFVLCMFLTISLSYSQLSIYGQASLDGNYLHSNYLMDNDFKSKFKIGGGLGIVLNYRVADELSIETGINYVIRDYKVNNRQELGMTESFLISNVSFDRKYLEIPISVVRNFEDFEKLELYFGLYYGLNLAGSDVLEFTLENLPEGLTEEEVFIETEIDKRTESNYDKNDYGFKMGFGYIINSNLKFRLMTQMGLSEISNESSENRSLLGIGINLLYKLY